MHVGVISGRFQPDRCGVAHYTERLRRELARRGVRSTVFTEHATASAPGAVDVRGVTPGWSLRDMLPLALAVRRANPDVLHIQHAAGTYRFRRGVFALPALLRAVGWRGPIVTTLHEYGWWEWRLPGPLHRPAWKAALWGEARGLWDREDGFLVSLSDAVIATHPATRRVVLERLPRTPLHSIPLAANVDVAPVDRETARRELRKRFGWPHDTTVIAFFGFLHPVKGLRYLIEAFAGLRAAHPGLRLLLCGGVESLALSGGEAREFEAELHAQVRQLGLEGLVGFSGYLPDGDASRLLSGADLGALPFTHGLNLKSGSLLTLLAHGLPLVGTRSEPPVEEFASLPALRLVPVRDAASLQRELQGLLAEEREPLAKAGRDFVERFAWPAVVDQHLRIYQELLSGR